MIELDEIEKAASLVASLILIGETIYKVSKKLTSRKSKPKYRRKRRKRK